MSFYFFIFITLSTAKGFPSEIEDNDLSRIQNLSPDIKSEHEDSVKMDKIQGDLRKQKTVVEKMISNIKDEMTEMKACLLSGGENIAESISGCTAALEQSIQEALDWATPRKEDHAGIKDPGESHRCLIMIAGLFKLD